MMARPTGFDPMTFGSGGRRSIQLSDRAIEWVDNDELVEVTPTAIRVRKRVLAANQRPRTRKGAA